MRNKFGHFFCGHRNKFGHHRNKFGHFRFCDFAIKY